MSVHPKAGDSNASGEDRLIPATQLQFEDVRTILRDTELGVVDFKDKTLEEQNQEIRGCLSDVYCMTLVYFRGQPAGYSMTQKRNWSNVRGQSPDNRLLKICKLYVRKCFQRRKLGRRMVDEIQQRAIETQVRFLYLNNENPEFWRDMKFTANSNTPEYHVSYAYRPVPILPTIQARDEVKTEYRVQITATHPIYLEAPEPWTTRAYLSGQSVVLDQVYLALDFREGGQNLIRIEIVDPGSKIGTLYEEQPIQNLAAQYDAQGRATGRYSTQWDQVGPSDWGFIQCTPTPEGGLESHKTRLYACRAIYYSG